MIARRYNIRKFDLFLGDTKLLKGYFGKFSLFCAAVMVLVVLNTSKFENIRSTLYDFSGTTYSAVSYPIYWAKSKYISLKNYFTVLGDNKDIYLENQKLKEELHSLGLLKKENEDLKQLLNFQDNISFSKVTGRVVLESSEDFHARYLLNVGLQNGIQKGNAVVDHNRLVGRVMDVSDRYSKIQLLTDKHSKVPISILNTHWRGVAAGTYQDGHLKLLYLPENAEVNDGQIVVTSGEERYIPHGIYVGKIIKRDKEIYIEVPKNTNENLALVSVLKLEDNFADARTKTR
jgi:rod shape-determining protein MreC